MAEGMTMEFVEADAEKLPFDRDSFDVVLSTFGVLNFGLLLPKCSATTDENGKTVDEPTMLM